MTGLWCGCQMPIKNIWSIKRQQAIRIQRGILEAILAVCKAITSEEILKITSVDSSLLQIIRENRNDVNKWYYFSALLLNPACHE